MESRLPAAMVVFCTVLWCYTSAGDLKGTTPSPTHKTAGLYKPAMGHYRQLMFLQTNPPSSDSQHMINPPLANQNQTTNPPSADRPQLNKPPSTDSHHLINPTSANQNQTTNPPSAIQNQTTNPPSTDRQQPTNSPLVDRQQLINLLSSIAGRHQYFSEVGNFLASIAHGGPRWAKEINETSTTTDPENEEKKNKD